MSIETSHSSSSELSNARKPALPPKPKLALAESENPTSEHTNSDKYSALISSLREKLNINISGPGSERSLALSTLSSSSDTAGLKSFNLGQNMNDLSLLDEIYAEIEDKYLFHKAKSAESKTLQSSCSCSHSSQSSQSSCSCSYTSESVADRPPLPSVPPPNLVSSHSDEKRMSLSLEEEIALEIRAKLNQEYLVSKKVESRSESREGKMEQSAEMVPDTPVLEPEYLEPISLSKTDKRTNEKKMNKTLSDPASPKTNSDFILSPSKLKSYLVKSPSSRNPPLDPSQSRTFSYLLKQSNRITSTLRLMRTKSSSNHVHNQSIYSQPIEQKCYQSTVNVCAEHSQVEISQPTLISQTFDLNKQALIEIKHGQKQADGLRSSSSFNSSFDTSSTSSVYSSKTEYEHSNDDSINGSNKKFHDHSPTIESNLIITNVYEEDETMLLKLITLKFLFFMVLDIVGVFSGEISNRCFNVIKSSTFSYEIDNDGFHKFFSINIQINTDEIHFLKTNCNIMLIQEFNSNFYVDEFELKQNIYNQLFLFFLSQKVNTESIEYRSKPFLLFLLFQKSLLSCNESSNLCNLSFSYPFHLRYHAPSDNYLYQRLKIYGPRVLVSDCNQNLKDQNEFIFKSDKKIDKILIKEFFIGNCYWNEIDSNYSEDSFEFDVPVGQAKHAPIIIVITLGFLILLALYVSKLFREKSLEFNKKIN